MGYTMLCVSYEIYTREPSPSYIFHTQHKTLNNLYLNKLQSDEMKAKLDCIQAEMRFKIYFQPDKDAI